MAKFFVTGSNGFIGSHIKDRLERDGHTVHSVNHRHLVEASHYVNGLLEKLQPDHIIHCASAGNMYGVHTDEMILHSNIWSVFNLLKATKNIPYKSFINFSSLSVGLPVTTIYGASKIAAEAICKSYVDSYGKPIVSVAPASVYGPREQEKHLIPTLIRSCLEGESMSFVSNPVHDYIYIDDLVDAVLLLTVHVKALKGGYMEIGSGEETSNQQIKKMIETLTGKKADTIISSEIRPYDVKKGWTANIDKMVSLGWIPKTPLEKGLQTVIEDYKRQHAV